MDSESDFQEELFGYFLTEAPELLVVIEETLLSLIEEKTVDKVHTLMRSAHTLKGSAASVRQETIKTIAHHLEDVFQSLYPDELEIDPELGTLLLEGYECLRTPLSALIANLPYDENTILEQTATVFAQLQTRLGDFFGREAPLPTSEELGFDVVESIFQDSIIQDLEALEAAIVTQDSQEIEQVLRSQIEFFLDLGTSYELPGLVNISQTLLSAINNYGDSIPDIATIALDNFQQARKDILAGDREWGGKVSTELQYWVETKALSLETEDNWEYTSIISPEEIEIEECRLEPELDSGELTLDTNQEYLENEAKLEIEEVYLTEEFATEAECQEEEVNIIPFQEETESIEVAKAEPHKPISILEKIIQSITVTVNPGNNTHSSQTLEFATPSQNKQASRSPSPTIRVALEQLDRLNHTVGELFIKENQKNLQQNRLQLLVRETFQEFYNCQQQLFKVSNWSEKQRRNYRRKQRRNRHNQRLSMDNLNFNSKNQLTANTLVAPSAQITESRFDPLEMDIYSDLDIVLRSLTDNMMQLRGKIEAIDGILQQSQLDLSKGKQLLDRAQEELLQARMVPLSTVLNRFGNHIQQMVATHKKPAQLKIIGAEVTIDKAIAEKLCEPLLHLVRNAYDHGIEAPEIRQQRHKSETGVITIHAYNQGNRTIIKITDDGNGVNWERVLNKAIDKQLLNGNQVTNITEHQLADILFQPGFSTAPTVTDLSGRGVGLDLVKNQIEALDGSISVRSEQHEGTTFILKLPLNLTTSRLIICQSKGIIYGFLSTEIERVLSPLPGEIQYQPSMTETGSKSFWCYQKEEVRELIPICPLEELVNYQYPLVFQNNSLVATGTQKKYQERHHPLLLIQTEGKKICLEVEKILAEQELVIKSLKSLATLPSYIQGYSVLGDSNLALVINPLELLTHGYNSQIFTSDQQSLSLNLLNQTIPSNSLSPSNPHNNKNSQILVVEDSIVQRQCLVLTLEKVGYQVIQAGNGQEAIEKLNLNPEISVAICDIEMPVMNGFELLSHCQQNSQLSHVYFVMLTTRSGQKHRQLALSLGARAYLTKPTSDRQLIDVIFETLSNLSNKDF